MIALANAGFAAEEKTRQIDLLRLDIASIYAITNGQKPADDPEHGLANLFDTGMNMHDESYWLSDGGDRNWIVVKFSRPVDVEQLWILAVARHAYPRRVPSHANVYALMGQNEDFEPVGQDTMYGGSNRIELENAFDVREILITFPGPLPVLANRLVVQGRAPADIDQTKTRPRIASENRKSISDFLPAGLLPKPSTPPLKNCSAFDAKLDQCESLKQACAEELSTGQDLRPCVQQEAACVSVLVEQVVGCLDNWQDSSAETGTRLLETHRFLMEEINISARDGCPKYFYRWGGLSDCQYEHTILVRLENQFPDSRVLYDAARLSARHVSEYYECEGNWDCYIESSLYHPRWLLEQYPGSPYASEAVDWVLKTVDMLDKINFEERSYSGSTNLAEEINTLRGLAPQLEPELSEKMLSALSQIESHLQSQFPDLPIFYEPDWLQAPSLVKHADCRDNWDCIVENKLYPMRWYLERHGGSPHQEEAYDRALEAIKLLDEMDFRQYGFSQTDNLTREIEAFRRVAGYMPRELETGLERLEFHLEIEDLFAEISSGNPRRYPLEYMSHAREELLERISRSELEVAPEPKDDWMLVWFEIAEIDPDSYATLVLCKFAESRYEAAQNWLLDYMKDEEHRIDPAQCHPDMAERMRLLSGN